ncbi:MAG TPA: DegV family protein [Bacillota bacterium]|nr:DegV family protein [Bacillota bacterium]
MAIRLVVDSGSDLLKNVAQERNIEIVPLKVAFGEESFTDGVDIDHDLFYKKMKESEHIPMTSLPSPQDFVDVFTRIGAEHEIICITISSATSGTYQSAKIASETLPDHKITLVDSMNISMATGALALKASEMIDSGATSAEILAALTEMKQHMHTFIAINDWTNVIKGGRVSNWQGALAQVLRIKPTLYLTRTGEIHVKDKARGRSRQLANVVEFIKETGKELNGGTIYMLHSMAPQEELDRMESELRATFSPKDVVVYRLGPIMGSHGGFGTIGFVV